MGKTQGGLSIFRKGFEVFQPSIIFISSTILYSIDSFAKDLLLMTTLATPVFDTRNYTVSPAEVRSRDLQFTCETILFIILEYNPKNIG